MGFWSGLKAMFRRRKAPCKVLVVGLDNSGKTTILNQLRSKEEDISVVPTVGYNIEEFSSGGLQFSCFDMSGQSRYRDLWRRFYSEAQAIIFVLDAADQLRLGVAQVELEEVLRDENLTRRRVPLLMFANKMDLPNACGPVEITQQMKMDLIVDRPWTIFPSVATTGEGLEEGIKWLIQRLNR